MQSHPSTVNSSPVPDWLPTLERESGLPFVGSMGAGHRREADGSSGAEQFRDLHGGFACGTPDADEGRGGRTGPITVAEKVKARLS